MPSLRQHAGYLIVDHSESPGVSPADFPRGFPKGTVFVGKGHALEADVQMCAHCQRAVLLNPERQRQRGYCAKCDHYICDAPGCQLECRPIAHVLERLQNAAEKGGIVLTDA